MKRLARNISHFWPTLIVVGVILYATWTSSPLPEDELPKIPHLDKLIHAIMMGGFFSAVTFDWRRLRYPKHILSTKTLLVITGIAIAFSAIDEYCQGILPIGRPSDPLDFAADCFGILVAYFAAPPTINYTLQHTIKRHR